MDYSAAFDLVIAAALVSGLSYSLIPTLTVIRYLGVPGAQAALLIPLVVTMVPLQHSELFGLLFDLGFRNEIDIRERIMAEAISKVRATPCDADCPSLISFYADTLTFIDDFNT